MDHQAELEKQKYRNWVRGGLAYKYLKQGIEGFADDIVLQEHNRILHDINHTPGLTYNQCSLRSFLPKHRSTGTGKCPWSQLNCSCLKPKNKHPCPNGVCDAILEEILKSHGSQPPTPYWKNTDIQMWCSSPWEVAKCFINSPGYSDKTTASDIDAPGLLHVFINNVNLHSHLSCTISGSDVLSKTLKKRNTIFHSPTMELEDKELNDCIDDIIAILKDDKELKQRHDAKRAVENLNKLKQKSFVITTNNEVEVCRDAMKSINDRSEELKQMIQHANVDLDKRKTEVCEAVDDRTQKALEEALKQLEIQSDNQLHTMKQAVELMNRRLKHIETDTSVINQRVLEIETRVEKLDITRNVHQKQLEYVEQKKALQGHLLERYEKDYFKTWISPLKTQENDVDINEVYVTPNMVVEKKVGPKASTKSLSQTEIHRSCANVRHDRSVPTLQTHRQSGVKTVTEYRDIFQTDGIKHKKIYVIGDIGTGKSSLCKMMIFNWCKAVRGDSKDKTKSTGDHYSENVQATNVTEMCKFDFLFTISLQRMSGFSSDIKQMIKATYKDLMTKELMSKIFNDESESCLIIADGLDEWTPPNPAPSPQHVSYGIPVADGVKHATLVTLSRPSAKGILNIKLTEYDQKIKLLGVHEKSVYNFICKYMDTLYPNTDKNDFMGKIKQANLEHLEETPLILQQLIWMYCTTNDIGTSVGDIYSNIVNIMFRWSEIKEEEDETESFTNTSREFDQMQLPELLRRFPRCEDNQGILLLLGRFSIKELTEDISCSTFGRSKLRRCGLSVGSIATLIRSGILLEYKSFDPTYERTYLSFIHKSYLEFFAAVYISSHSHQQYQTQKKKSILQSRTILEELFMKYNSAYDILQLSNLLKMICGLSPFLLEDISEQVSKNMIGNEIMIRHRQTLSLYQVYSYGQDEVGQIQKLIYECFLDCKADYKPAVSICDVIITCDMFYREKISRNLDMSFIQKIVSNSVLSNCMNCSYIPSKPIVECFKWIAELPQLQCIRIDCITSCEICEELSSSLSRVVSLKHLTLWDINCDRADCGGHAIDLSHHDQLRSIHIESCSCMLGSVLNAKSLQEVFISGSRDRKISHALCEHLSTSLSQAMSLQQLTLKDITCNRADCRGHVIDLPNHNQLRSVRTLHCSCVLGSVVNTESLTHVDILGLSVRRTAHGICENLSSLLTQASSLNTLTLKDITCDRDDCEGHAIDLSNHDQLQSIRIERCSCMLGSVFNAKMLQKVFISGSFDRRSSHVLCELLSLSLSQADSLQKLTLKDITCDDCEGHTIDLSNHDQLQKIHLVKCSFVLSSLGKTKSLQKVSIFGNPDRRTAHVLCEVFSSSFIEAVSLKYLTLSCITCAHDDCEGHTIKMSKNVQIVSIHLENCSFMLSTVVNTKRLEKVYISGSHDHRTAHASCEYLSSPFTVPLKSATLRKIVCKLDDSEGDTSDLIIYDRLKMIHYDGDVSFSNTITNEGQLERSCHNSNMKHLNKHIIYQYTPGFNTFVHTLRQLRILKLENTDIDENALTVTSGMQNLIEIQLRLVAMSLPTWCSFIDSLHTLGHSVWVRTHMLSIGQRQEDAARQYVRQNREMSFRYIDAGHSFYFSS